MSDTKGRTEDVTSLLDDQPITDKPYRLGDQFVVYENGAGVKYKVTQIVERENRRITYGEPVVARG